MLKEDMLERYGVTMTVVDLAELLHMTKGAIYNKISMKLFTIPTFKVGNRVYAVTSDVAKYIDDENLLRE